MSERINGRATVKCTCDCGNIVIVAVNNLVTGTTKSCGCLKKDIAANKNKSHGMAGTRLYAIWTQMLGRCRNPNNHAYKSYGGRGIRVCDEWQKNYEVFQKWAIDNGYENGLTLKRKDNAVGYSPYNCRWATRKEQANNRRSNVNVTLNGETHNLTEWCEILGLSINTVISRIRKQGMEVNEALMTPIKNKSRKRGRIA